jgi:hypothetical protein
MLMLSPSVSVWATPDPTPDVLELGTLAVAPDSANWCGGHSHFDRCRRWSLQKGRDRTTRVWFAAILPGCAADTGVM